MRTVGLEGPRPLSTDERGSLRGCATWHLHGPHLTFPAALPGRDPHTSYRKGRFPQLLPRIFKAIINNHLLDSHIDNCQLCLCGSRHLY